MSRSKQHPAHKPPSPSQTLRNTLFLLWEREDQGFDDFEKYYNHHMKRLIDHFKSKL